MANTIQIKRKTTTGAPLLSSLSDGEMCLVVPDSNLYMRTNATTLLLVNGGITKDYASFYLNSGGLTAQSNVTRTVVINQTSVNSNPAVFSLSANQVTISKTGNFKIDFGCYFNNSSTSRTEYTFWLELDSVEVPGSRSGNYQRGYDSGQSSDISIIIPVVSGQVLRVRVNRTDGGSTAGYQDNNGTRLTIEEK